MTAFFTMVFLGLIIVTVWQISKMYQFSMKLKEENSAESEIANDKDNNTQGYFMFAFLVFIYFLTIFGFYKWGHFVLGTPSSEHGESYDTLFYLSMIIIFIVQIITQALLYYFAFKYRGKKTNKALYYADNNRLEFIWTTIPVIVLAALILYGLWAWSNIMNIDEQKDNPMIIELYAQQFNWKVRYAGEDNVLGDANVRFLNDFDGRNIFGIDKSDINGLDDVMVTSELHLPVNKKLLFKMRSQDVLHSAYMPHFRAQMNCVPGMVTQFGLTPNVTTEDMRQNPAIIEKVKRTNKIRLERKAKGEDIDFWEFDYMLICNKICGTSHYRMKLKIIVETQQEFDKWIAKQQTFTQMIAGQ